MGFKIESVASGILWMQHLEWKCLRCVAIRIKRRISCGQRSKYAFIHRAQHEFIEFILTTPLEAFQFM